jgi:hypothetical protein
MELGPRDARRWERKKTTARVRRRRRGGHTRNCPLRTSCTRRHRRRRRWPDRGVRWWSISHGACPLRGHRSWTPYKGIDQAHDPAPTGPVLSTAALRMCLQRDRYSNGAPVVWMDRPSQVVGVSYRQGPPAIGRGPDTKATTKRRLLHQPAGSIAQSITRMYYLQREVHAHSDLPARRFRR